MPEYQRKMNELLREVTQHFAFLGVPDAPEWVAPESFRGGFVLRYPTHKIEIEYLEYQFTVRGENEELFGTRNPGRYSGNMFTPEHLVPQLPEIADRVQAQLFGGA